MVEIFYEDESGNVCQAMANTYGEAIDIADSLMEKGYQVTIQAGYLDE